MHYDIHLHCKLDTGIIADRNLQQRLQLISSICSKICITIYYSTAYIAAMHNFIKYMLIPDLHYQTIPHTKDLAPLQK